MIEEQLKEAKLACRKMQNIDKYTKMDALDAISKGLLDNIDYILGENAKDIAAWLQGDETFEECLKASDERVKASSAN